MRLRTREFAKSLGYWLATLAVLPALAGYYVRARILGRDRALEGSSQALSLVPGLLGHYVRRAFYARTLAQCHRTVTIEFGVLLSKAGACLDENVYIGPRCHLGLVHLERDVLLGPGVHVPSGRSTHGTGSTTLPIREQAGRYETVTIGAGSWIGSAAVVMADVGRETVVGAGSVVVHPLPDAVIAVGTPAKPVRPRERAGAAPSPTVARDPDAVGKAGIA